MFDTSRHPVVQREKEAAASSCEMFVSGVSLFLALNGAGLFDREISREKYERLRSLLQL
jgi:hypothetical protein